jgi:hypothetical protein
MIAWQDYAAAARRLVGASVRHAGRIPAVGLDCVGVPYAAAVEAGLHLDATPFYGCQPSEQELVDGLHTFCDPADDVSTAHIWQVPFLGGARHVVVPLHDIEGGTLCVHAWSRRGRVVQTRWRRHTAQGWHIRGIAWRAQPHK